MVAIGKQNFRDAHPHDVGKVRAARRYRIAGSR
jgi:hypothetical protein